MTLVKSFLQDHQQFVKINNSWSATVEVKVSAPQGTKIGPWLWITYVNDLHSVPGSGNNAVKAVIYADDTTLYQACHKFTQSDELQLALNRTIEWSNENNMLLNADKPTLMNISHISQVGQTNQLTLGTTVLTVVLLHLGLKVSVGLYFESCGQTL